MAKTPSNSYTVQTAKTSGDNNPGYGDKGSLGTYQTAPGDFPDPEGMIRFTGYGADEEDLRKGFVEPIISELPVYDLANHKQKWTQPRIPDEDSNGGEDLPQDIEFRMKDRETKGLFMRPHLPTER